MNGCHRCPLLFAGQRYWSVSETCIFFIWDYFFTDSFFYFNVSVASLSFATMVLGKVKSFTISFDCLNDSNVPVFSSGDCVSGRVIIEVTGEIRVKSLKIQSKGLAKVRWTESRNAGSNTAYTQNYTEEVEYLNHKDILIGHERGKKVDLFLSISFWGTDALCAGCSPMNDSTTRITKVISISYKEWYNSVACCWHELVLHLGLSPSLAYLFVERCQWMTGAQRLCFLTEFQV